MASIISERFTEEKMNLFMGNIYTRTEFNEIQNYGGIILPENRLPGIMPQKIPAAIIPYRRRVYGPYDHIDPDQYDIKSLKSFRYASHRGQTKLCAIELEAIAKIIAIHPEIDTIVYAGAAPGDHIVFLSELYPQLAFHCYDPADFNIEKLYSRFPTARGKISIYRQLFTDDDAKRWSDANVFFISDIRSGTHENDNFENEVADNMKWQQDWVQIMNPIASLLKFRLPYTDGENATLVEYLDGEILLQPFGPNTSTEGRLLTLRSDNFRKRMYNPIDYENFYFWLNTILREWASFDMKFDLSSVKGLCCCFDCSRLIQIFRSYTDDDISVAKLINRMINATHQPLLQAPHGESPNYPMFAKRVDLTNKYSDLFVDRKLKRIHNNKKRIPPKALIKARPDAYTKK